VRIACFANLFKRYFPATFFDAASLLQYNRNERFVSHSINFRFRRQLLTHTSQQRPRDLAPKPVEYAEVSTEDAASDGERAGSQIDSRLIKPSTKFGFHQRSHMKVWMFSVVLGVLSLVADASSALSQGTAADLTAQSSASQTKQLSEIFMATKPGVPASELPDAPQATGVNSVDPVPSHRMGPGPLLPQTFHDKFLAYAVSTAGPRALFGPAFPAAIRMANPPSHFPDEWRQGAGAFGRNYGDQLATVSTLQTARFAFGAALHEDLRYHPSTSTNFFMRTGHALVFNFVDRSDDGHARLAIANFAGLTAGGYVGMSYLPSGFNDMAHADQRVVFQFSRLAGSNLGAEFGPDIFRFLAEHHLPRPKIPIPDWWVKR
jgi:hypothetical protein